MDDMQQAFLYDAFNMYYSLGVRARQQGDEALARRQLLKAAETLLKLAAISNGALKRARIDRAERLMKIAGGGETVERQSVDKPAGANVPQAGDETGETDRRENRPPDTRFADVAGLDEVKEAVYNRVILPHRYPDVYKRFDKKPGGGVLLYGPPGTGKTMIARATAGEAGAAFFPISCSDILSKWFGEAEKNVRALFDKAAGAAAAVIFFDEFEALGATRDGADPAMQRLIPELLAQMDGFGTRNNTLLLMAATNKPWLIDTAFLRPGRFGEKIYVPLPDEAARLYMLGRNLGHLPLDGVDLRDLARRTEGYSGADIKEVCERSKQPAILRAIESGRTEYTAITRADVEAALGTVAPSVSADEIARMERFRAESESAR